MKFGVLLLILGLCGSFKAEATGDSPPSRLVVAGGALTEIVAALGLEDRLVGVDLTSTYPPSIRLVPRIGYLRSLSTEGVLSLRPDHVLLAEESGPPVVVRQLEAQVPLTRIPSVATVEGVRQRILAVAKILGVTAVGDRLLAKFNAAWREAEVLVARGSEHPRVLFILAHGGGGPLVAGQGTAADAVIRLAGGQNAAAALEGYKPLTPESALEAKPDWLLITDEGLATLGGEKALLANPAVKMTPAGRSGRVISLESLLLLGFGPRLPEAVTVLAHRWQTVPASR